MPADFAKLYSQANAAALKEACDTMEEENINIAYLLGDNLKVKELNNNMFLKAYILTFGCQQNEADSEKLSGMAEAMGYEIVDKPEYHGPRFFKEA